MYQLKIIVASTRPGRVGIHVANWFAVEVKKYHEFKAEVLDLGKINLPLIDEPHHPKIRKYTKEHTKEWSRKIEEADAFVVITPEYNHFAPPALINAIDYLYEEWSYKPVGIISYGGISGGLRAAQSLKELMGTVKLVPVVEAVSLSFIANRIDVQGNFQSDDRVGRMVSAMMRELLKWTRGLKKMREDEL